MIVQGSSDPHLLVLDLDTASSAPTHFADLDYLCSFHYPELASSFSAISIAVRADPAPDWRPHPGLRVPFSLARADRLLVVTIWVLEGHIPSPLLSHVPASTLLRAAAGVPAGERRRRFAWAEWGPAGSRLFVAPPTHTSVWVCYVYGMTFAMALRQGSQKWIITFDYNPLEVRRRVAREAGAEAETGAEGAAGAGDRSILVANETEFSPAKVFKEEVVTSLPYRLKRILPFSPGGAEGEGHFDAVMVSEDSLVLVSSVSTLDGFWDPRMECFY